jgi:hypothetical protein
MGNRSLATFAGPAAQCGLARLRHNLRPPSWFDDQVWYAVSRFSVATIRRARSRYFFALPRVDDELLPIHSQAMN